MIMKAFHSRKLSSAKQWINRQSKDPFVRQRHLLDYRSRSAFKLKEILEKFKIKAVHSLDLGSSPGGWSQVLASVSKFVVAIDQVEMDPIKNVLFIHGKIQDDCVQNQLLEIRRNWDLITSDMSPSFSGNPTADVSRAFNLVQCALDQCKGENGLVKGGSFIVKFFQGDGETDMKKELESNFKKVIHFKPKASRSESREGYWVCLGWKG